MDSQRESTTSRFRAGTMYSMPWSERRKQQVQWKTHTPRTCSRASMACHPLSQMGGGNVSLLLSFLSCNGNASSRLGPSPSPRAKPSHQNLSSAQCDLLNLGKSQPPMLHRQLAPEAHAPRATKGDQGRRSGSNGCLCHRRHRSAPHRDHINSCVLVFVERIAWAAGGWWHSRAENWRRRRRRRQGNNVHSRASSAPCPENPAREGRDTHTHTHTQTPRLG
jgi:hypothetical protein